MKFTLTSLLPALLLSSVTLADKVPFERLNKDDAVGLPDGSTLAQPTLSQS